MKFSKYYFRFFLEVEKLNYLSILIRALAGKFDVKGMKSLKSRDFQHIRFYYLLHLLMRFKLDRKYIER